MRTSPKAVSFLAQAPAWPAHAELERLEALLESGSAVSESAPRFWARNPSGESPLHIAASLGLSRLCSAWANSERCSEADHVGATPLMAAAQKGRLGALSALLEFSDINARSDSGASALHAAAHKGSQACMTALLDAGADPWALTLNGSTLLHRAVQSLERGAIELAMARCDIRALDANGLDGLDFLRRRARDARHGETLALLCYFEGVLLERLTPGAATGSKHPERHAL